MGYACASKQYTLDRIASRRSNRCSDTGDRGKDTFHMVALHTAPVSQATTNRLTLFLDCDPSIAALSCPKKMMLLERLAIKVLIYFTDAAWARLSFKPWSSSQAAPSSGSINSYSWKIESTSSSELLPFGAVWVSLDLGMSVNWKGCCAGLAGTAKPVDALDSGRVCTCWRRIDNCMRVWIPWCAVGVVFHRSRFLERLLHPTLRRVRSICQKHAKDNPRVEALKNY